MQKSLLVSGLLLFLLGLLNGILPMILTSRLALSSHLAAITHSMVLMILAVAWPQLALQTRAAKFAAWSNISGLYLIWLALLAGAFLGLGSAGDHPVTGLLSMLGSLEVVVGTGVVLAGAIKHQHPLEI